MSDAALFFPFPMTAPCMPRCWRLTPPTMALLSSVKSTRGVLPPDLPGARAKRAACSSIIRSRAASRPASGLPPLPAAGAARHAGPLVSDPAPAPRSATAAALVRRRPGGAGLPTRPLCARALQARVRRDLSGNGSLAPSCGVAKRLSSERAGDRRQLDYQASSPTALPVAPSTRLLERAAVAVARARAAQADWLQTPLGAMLAVADAPSRPCTCWNSSTARRWAGS